MAPVRVESSMIMSGFMRAATMRASAGRDGLGVGVDDLHRFLVGVGDDVAGLAERRPGRFSARGASR
jgi:hypothetical protein